jgi:hypothetical protein
LPFIKGVDQRRNKKKKRMTILRVVKGDLLGASEKFIGQQCNCVTVKYHGLSALIVETFPWACPYSVRKPITPTRNCASTPDKPGTIRVFSSSSGPSVVCLFAQWAPGKPGDYAKFYPKDHDDTAENRLKWFKECLEKIDKDEEIDSPVAIPFQIGCGLAGGDWDKYHCALKAAKTKFVIYELSRKRKR